MPNAWDLGSARILASLGYEALATTSSGFAATLGRPDGDVGRDEVLAHAAALARATPLPVSADLENGYAARRGRAWPRRCASPPAPASPAARSRTGAATALYPPAVAAARVAAAVDAAGDALVVTGRAENHIRGVDDLADTVARLQAYEAAGAHVLYAPGLARIEDVRTVVGGRLPAGQRAHARGRPHRRRARRAPASRGSRSAARSPSPRSAPWSRPPASCARRAPRGSRSAAPPGSRGPRGLRRLRRLSAGGARARARAARWRGRRRRTSARAPGRARRAARSRPRPTA